jgi:hypothetical protein
LEKKPQKSQSDALQDRKRLTFEQAEGVEPLPAQLQLKELSPALRAALWAVVLRSVDEAVDSDSWGSSRVGDPWDQILKDRHVYRLYEMADDFTDEAKVIRPELKKIFHSGS